VDIDEARVRGFGLPPRVPAGGYDQVAAPAGPAMTVQVS
jgi:hypothetical protein